MGKTFKKKTALGIVREMDDLGRIVIPKEFRKLLNMNPGTAIEMIATTEGLNLRVYESRELCIFCGEEAVYDYLGKGICEECKEVIGG